MNTCNLGLSQKALKAEVVLLNAILSDETVLYIKTLNYHWNVEGPHFGELHKFFAAQYEEVADIMDAVAERARALGGNACGSMKEFLSLARLKESLSAAHAKAMIQNFSIWKE